MDGPLLLLAVGPAPSALVGLCICLETAVPFIGAGENAGRGYSATSFNFFCEGSVVARTFKDVYRDAVAHTLAGYQLIESHLKVYISHHYEAVRYLLGDRLTFKWNAKELETLTLRRLTNVLEKLCDDKELIRDLRNVLDHRDQLAHQALVCLYGVGHTEAEFSDMADANLEVAEKLGSLQDRIHKLDAKLLEIWRPLEPEHGGGS